MIIPIYEGVILGFTLAFFFGFGPAFFAIIQTSMHRGFWSGVILAIGVFLSDVALVALCFFGAISIINEPANHLIFGIISGTILIVFGIVTYTRKVEMQDDKNNKYQNKPGPITYLLKGFFLNIANPFVWIFWMGVVVGITAKYSDDIPFLMLFFSTTLITVLLTDIFKCFGSYKIKKFLTHKIMEIINKAAGVGLVLFGLFLIARVIFEF
ncbi:MAG: LysE family translocator [Bacteroidales bacterium]|nr:LysE family translocator [Bacteroidales bacterium]